MIPQVTDSSRVLIYVDEVMLIVRDRSGWSWEEVAL